MKIQFKINISLSDKFINTEKSTDKIVLELLDYFNDKVLLKEDTISITYKEIHTGKTS